MKSTVASEFETVDLLLSSGAETRAVDAFSISCVKFEKQLRRLNANLIFQHSVFDGKCSRHKDEIRQAILEKRTANHNRFIGGIRKLSGLTAKELIGEQYRPLVKRIETAHKFRNKILHGQQTGELLERSDLEENIRYIKNWCELLAEGSGNRIGYDGFSRGSLNKNGRPDIVLKVDQALGDNWREFIQRI